MYRIESTIIEELKERDLNAIDLLQSEANAKRQKNKIMPKQIEALETTHIDAIKSLEVIVNDINNVHSVAEKELAARTIQAVEKAQKAIDELSLDG